MARRNDDDLIGSGPVGVPRRMGRPRKDDPTAPSNQPEYRLKKLVEQRRREAEKDGRTLDELEDDAEEAGLINTSIGHVMTGVSTTWLSQAFGFTRAITEKRIRGVRPVGYSKRGNPLYDLREVAGKLVEVEFDLQLYLKDVKDEDLPEELRLKFWQAKRARQRFEQDDAYLWRTELVMARFSELLLELREKVNQLPDRVARLTAVNSEQYRLFRAGTDEIMDDLYETAQKFARRDRTMFGMDPATDEDDLI